MRKYIPVFKRIKYSYSKEIVRELPLKGDLVVKPGEKVVPFTKIGRSSISENQIILPSNIKLRKNIEFGEKFFKDEALGRSGFKIIKAPFNGYLSQAGDVIAFNQEKRDFWILSGVWGEITEAVPGLSATIKTQTVDINLVAFSNKDTLGELIVFPNPSELLDLEYLKNFSNQTKGKIIYVGHYIRKEIVDIASSTGVTALIGGSMDRADFHLARAKGINIALITGFGKLKTPDDVFEFLKNVSSRHVLLNGTSGLLQVPMPSVENNKKPSRKSSIKAVKKGLNVIVFTKENFGESGVITEVQKDDIHVKLNKSQSEVVVKLPNILASD